MAKIYALLCILFCSSLLSAQQEFSAKAIHKKNASVEHLASIISEYEVYEIDTREIDGFLQKNVGDPFRLVFDDNNNWELALFPHDMLSANYAHRTTSGVVSEKSGKVITYQGFLKNPKGQETAMTIDEDFIYGYVNLNGEMLFIEPLQFLLGKDAPKNWFVVYNGEKVIDKSGSCAATDFHDHHEKHKESIPDEVHYGEKMACHTLEIAIASDFSMFQKYGSIGGVDAHNLGVLNNVQTNYDNEFVEEIQFEVVTSFTVDCSGCDPWSSTDNASNLLGSFRSWGNGGGFGGGITYDVAELWTDRNIQAGGNFGVIGIAYVPGICNTNRYHVLEDYSSTAWRLRVLTSHELGHNFSSGHDGSGSPFIMAPAVNNTNSWSTQSQNSINNYIGNLVNNGCLTPCGSFLPPIANFTADVQSGCVPLTVNFTDQSDNNPTTYNWTFPGGSPGSSTQQNPTVNYTVPGTYPVTMEVSNPAGTDVITVNNYIVVADQPNADFSFQIASNTVVFQDQSIGASIYNWDFGDGNGSNDPNPVHIYAEDGIYDVVLLIENACGISTSIQQVEIVTLPTANFSVTTTEGCAPFEVFFNNESSDNSTAWEWAFPGGTPMVSTDEFPIVVYNDPGIYDVTLQAYNTAGSDITVKIGYIEVLPATVADFTAAINGSTVDFTNASSNATTYAWNFGDSNVSTLENPQHTYAADGTYLVSLVATGPCGEAEHTMEVIISNAPVAGFTADMTTGCLPHTVAFTSTSTGAVDNYSWSFPGGNPSSSTDQNPTVVYETAGTFSVSLEVSNAAGMDMTEMVDYITIGTTVAADFSYTINGTMVDFVPTNNNADSYLWDFGNGNQSTDMNASFDFQTFGSYTVSLTTSNECGDETTQESFEINTLPSAGFTQDQIAGCAPLTVQFTDQSSANTDSWSWSFPGGNPSSSTDQNPTVTYDVAGQYDVNLTVTNEVGQDIVLQENLISVTNVPSGSISSVQTDNTFDFSSNANNSSTYFWDFGDGGTSAVENPTHTFAPDQIYTVTLTLGNACGEVTYNETINLTTSPVADFSSNATFACEGETVQFFSNATGTVNSWAWEFPGGNPSTSAAENPIVQYDNAGTYDVILTVSNSTESNSTTSSDYISVGNAPSASFTYSVDGLVVDFSENAMDATAYAWTFSDGATSDLENPTHTFENEGSYDVSLEVTNACGTDTYAVTIELMLAPSAGISVANATGCAPFEVQYQDNSSGTVDAWEWSFPGGNPSTSNLENPVVTYTSAGIYSATLIATNDAGSDSYTAENVVEIGQEPTASFTAAVNGLEVDFSNTSSNDSYLWDFGDGQSSSAANPNHTYSTGAIYTVSLTVTNDCGSDEFTMELDLTVAPEAGFDFQVLGANCAPIVIQFEDNSTGTVDSWMWEFPGGTPASSTAANPVITYANVGSFDVSLTVSNPSNSDSFVLTDAIIVSGGPTADFTFDIDFLTVDFVNASSNENSYSWDFGDGNTSNSENPTHTYAFDGIFTVTLEVSNVCGTESYEQVVNLTSTPLATVNINSASEGCPGMVVDFEDGSSGTVTAWNWTFPGGTPATSSVPNPSVTYDTPGQYDVFLEVSSSAGVDQINLSNAISVSSLPVAAFLAINQSPSFAFTNQSQSGTSYLWDFGDGEASMEENPTHVYSMDGIYQVSLTTSNDCGADIFTTSINVVTGPIANFMAVNTAGCAPFEVQLTDMSSDNVDDWSWSFPGGSPENSTEQNPTVTYSTSGAFDVFLTVSNAAGEVSTSRLGYIEVSDIPSADFNFSQNANAISFNNNSTNFNSYNWDFGDGNTSAELNPTHTYAANGSYQVTLTTTNSCGESSSMQTVTISNITIPVANFSITQNEGCAPFETTFSNASSPNADSWTWNFPGGMPSNFEGENPPTISYAAPGNYTVMLIAGNSSGSDTLTLEQSILVQDVPQATFMVSQNELNISFAADQADATTYAWDFGDGNTGAGQNVMHAYTNAGNYEVSLTVTNACGSNTTMSNIEVQEGAVAPVAQFSSDIDAGCAPLIVQFTDMSSNTPTAWNWDFEGGSPSSSTEQHPVVTYENPGAYEVSLKISNSAGEDNSLVAGFINILPPPIADFGFVITNGNEVEFMEQGMFATAYAWDFGDGNVSDEANPMHTYESSGNFEATLTVSNECGEATFTQTVEVLINNLETLEGIGEVQIYPNPTSGNVVLSLAGNQNANLRMSIHDVLGHVVHSRSMIFTGNIQETIKLGHLPSGTYFLQLSDENKSIYRKIILSR